MPKSIASRRQRKGVLGVESAIVLIAFVVVAAALAFVVLNAGFGTTQKAKTTIQAGVTEATSGIEVAGAVVGNVTSSKLHTLSIPIKLATGAGATNVEPALTAVKLIITGSVNVAYDNIYNGTNSDEEFTDFTDAIADTKAESTIKGDSDHTEAFIWWSNNRNNNDILDAGEDAVLTVIFRTADRPSSLDDVKVELVVATGAAMTLERTVPALTTSVVDLE